MKLLIDANLSPRLIPLLSDLFPSSLHVQEIHDESAEDHEIWDYALEHNYVIVTKDADFDDMAQLAMQSPKIIWIRRGNCSTEEIENILRTNNDAILSLA